MSQVLNKAVLKERRLYLVVLRVDGHAEVRIGVDDETLEAVRWNRKQVLVQQRSTALQWMEN